MHKAAIVPVKEFLTASELREHFGIYPQLRYKWTNNRGFPSPKNGKYETSAVIAWLRARGWNIEIV